MKIGETIVNLPQIFAGVAPGYHAQWSQDYYADKLFFKGASGGVFVDVGANEGVGCNNSYYFESKLGWKGICVEPIPKMYELLRASRKCLCFQACAYDKAEVVEFNYVEGLDLSGIVKEYDPRHIDRIQAEKVNYNLPQPDVKLQVMAMPLQWFVEAAGFKTIDFLSIDTEGSEFSVLKGLNFEKTHVNVICFEDNYSDKTGPIIEYLLRKGFQVVMRIGGDIMMVNRNLRFSWNNAS
jgi:FkbM family methyltransferase